MFTGGGGGGGGEGIVGADIGGDGLEDGDEEEKDGEDDGVGSVAASEFVWLVGAGEIGGV